MAHLRRIFCVKIALRVHARHVVHCRRHSRFHTRVKRSSIQRHAAPAADANDADTLRIHVVTAGEIIHRCLEIFGVDIRRGHVAWFSAAFASERRIKSEGEKSALCHDLRVEAAGLFLHSAERTADGNRCQLAAGILWHVEISRQRDAVTIVEGHLAVVHFIRLWENLVPFLSEL